MSLHIESTENALAELKKQRTKTLTAAISVSFLGIADRKSTRLNSSHIEESRMPSSA